MHRKRRCFRRRSHVHGWNRIARGGPAWATRQKKESRCSNQNKGEAIMTVSTAVERKTVSQKEWLAARLQLLAREKQLTHLSDAISAERLAMPRVRVEKNYLFDTPTGKK